MPMKRRKLPILRQPQRRTVSRPTCCTNCQTLYDQVHADLAKLGPSPFAVDPGVLYEALQSRRPCLLCGDPQICHGQLFLPTRIHWREGAILYFLCKTCLALPTPARALRVEAVIMAGLVGRRN
jgi:hypothetical protein